MSSVLDRPVAVASYSSLPGAHEILTDGALGFIAELHERFDDRRKQLLADRMVQLKYVAGVSDETVRRCLKKTRSSPG